MSWRDETCETCANRVRNLCHRRPPALQPVILFPSQAGKAAYPKVRRMVQGQMPGLMVAIYHDACAEHAPREEGES